METMSYSSKEYALLLKEAVPIHRAVPSRDEWERTTRDPTDPGAPSILALSLALSGLYSYSLSLSPDPLPSTPNRHIIAIDIYRIVRPTSHTSFSGGSSGFQPTEKTPN